MKILQTVFNWIVSLFSPPDRWDDYVTPSDKALKDLENWDKIHPKGTSTFDPNSDRAKKGIAFQKSVLDQLQEEFPGNDTFEECWDYFKKQDPSLSIYELACLEKEHGDITFVHEGQRFWVECCFAMGKETSWFCEMKRIKFRGINKWYCWGKIDQPGKTWFIQSKPWNDYVSKCERVRQGKKSFRIVPKHLIGDNLYKAKRGVNAFAEYIK